MLESERKRPIQKTKIFKYFDHCVAYNGCLDKSLTLSHQYFSRKCGFSSHFFPRHPFFKKCRKINQSTVIYSFDSSTLKLVKFTQFLSKIDIETLPLIFRNEIILDRNSKQFAKNEDSQDISTETSHYALSEVA